MLIGRDDERRAIADLIGGARLQRTGVLTIVGEPGIGKSTLCAWATDHAEGMRVLSATGVESESDLPFAGLAELFGSALEPVDTLPGRQGEAFRAALARGADAPVDRFAIGAAVLSVLATLAAETPVLVVVDDAHWLDAASADALRFAARRLRRDAVAILIATRPGSSFDGPASGLPQLFLEGLDRASSFQLLLAEHGPLASAVAERLVEHSVGNPLALVEIPLGLSAAQRAGDAAIEDPLPAGSRLADALLRRVAPLGHETRCALLVAAASGHERMQPVAGALRALGVGPAALGPAEEAGVLAVDGLRFEFRHPLLRSAIYHRASGPQRRAVHAALARFTEGEARAWHLAYATTDADEAVAHALEEAARSARQRGAPASAAAAHERAARLSPCAAARSRRLIEAARDAHDAGRAAAALALLDGALPDASDPVIRARIHHARARVLVLQGRGDAALPLLVEQVAAIRELDPELAGAMLAEACMASLLALDLERSLQVSEEACAVAAAAGPAIQALAATMRAVALTLSGRRAEGSALLDRALPALRLANPLTEAGRLVSAGGQALFWLERHDEAFELLLGLTRAARQGSAPTALILPLCCVAELEVRRGRWAVATADLEEAVDLEAEVAESVFAAYAHQTLARLAAANGDEAGCHHHAELASALAERHGNRLGRLYVQSALGLLELTLGRPEIAIERLLPAAELAEARGVGEPNIVHWQPDLVEAYARSGALDDARVALDRFAEQAASTGGAWALGAAARCRGLLSEGEEADEQFSDALVHLTAAQAPFDLARTHLCRGERLRRDGRRRDSRSALQSAGAMFEALGATPWAARARAELKATGSTRRAHGDRHTEAELTAHELQVARIVAEGASNREAAAALFLSPKTIEYHLAHIFRKLGIRNRTELAATAVARGWLDPNP